MSKCRLPGQCLPQDTARQRVGAASRYPQEEKREGCRVWPEPHSPVLNLDFRPERV